MLTQTKRIQGIFTPNIVPLHSRGRIHEEELRRYADWLVQKGVNGLYPNGSTGEFIRFSFEERLRITQTVVYALRDRVAVIAGAAEANAQATLKACEAYAELGCAAVSVCGPYYYKTSQEAVRAYFSEIARNSPIDILLYNIPQFATGISLDTLQALAELPRVVGMKDSSRDFPYFLEAMQLVRAHRPEFVFLTGTEEMLFPALLMGADGGTIATSGVVPEVVMELAACAQKGELEKGRRLQSELLPLTRAMFSVDFPEGFRAAVALRGFAMGEGRQPLGPAQHEALGRLRPALQSLIEALLGSIRQGGQR